MTPDPISSERRERLTPGLIRALLDMYTLPNPEVAPVFLDESRKLELLDLNSTPQNPQLNQRGFALVRMICATPLPVQKWIDPRDGRVVDYD